MHYIKKRITGVHVFIQNVILEVSVKHTEMSQQTLLKTEVLNLLLPSHFGWSAQPQAHIIISYQVLGV